VLSGAADLLVPGLSPYALSKRALRDYLDIVRLERSFPRSRVLTVWPGPIATRFNEKSRVHGSYRLPTGSPGRSARDVAERIYRAEQAGRRELVLSPVPRLAGSIQAIVPAFVRWLIRRHPSFRRPGPR
jgi:short-subunit dehydrogenase